MSTNVNRRHARTKGQPRRTWAPADSLPAVLHGHVEIRPDAPVLTEKQTAELLNEMDGELFRAVRANAGNEPRNTQEIFEHLAPRRTFAKVVARRVRWLVELGLWFLAVAVGFAIAPVLHGLGV